MKPVMKHITAHTCKKGRHWNMASFLTRRQRLALQAACSSTEAANLASAPNLAPSTPHAVAQQPAIHNPVPQEPETPLHSQPSTVSDLKAIVLSANSERIPEPLQKHALPAQNPTAQINSSDPFHLSDLGAAPVHPPQLPSENRPPCAENPLGDLGGFAVNSNVPPAPRNGKIARLPGDIRFRVSQMIRSGHSYSDISAKLAELGHPGISPANISNWKYGGFVDWLTERQFSERRLLFAQSLDRCTRSVDIDRIQQNTIALAADKLAHIIHSFDLEQARVLLSHQPELFPKFLAAIGTLSKSSVDLAKAFDLAQNREAAIRSRSADIPVGSAMETSTDAERADSPEQPTAPAAAPNLSRAEPPVDTTEPKTSAPDFNRFKPILGDFNPLGNECAEGLSPKETPSLPAVIRTAQLTETTR